jgi:hypothetical protein
MVGAIEETSTAFFKFLLTTNKLPSRPDFFDASFISMPLKNVDFNIVIEQRRRITQYKGDNLPPPSPKEVTSSA